jgi:hypothetical protein
VSIKIESHLSQGFVKAEVALPERNKPKKVLLRTRLPDGWKITSAAIGSAQLNQVDPNTFDLSALDGKQAIKFAVTHK